MTEKDIEDAQKLVEQMVQEINNLTATVKSLQGIVVDYQKFIVDHIGKPVAGEYNGKKEK